MSIIKSKGSVLTLSGGGLMGAVGQVISFETSGEENEVFDSTTIDNANQYLVFTATGFVNPGEVSAEIFYDPSLHSSVFTQLDTSPWANFTVAVSYGAGHAGSRSYACSQLSIGTSVATKDGVKMKLKMKRTGAAS